MTPLERVDKIRELAPDLPALSWATVEAFWCRPERPEPFTWVVFDPGEDDPPIAENIPTATIAAHLARWGSTDATEAMCDLLDLVLRWEHHVSTAHRIAYQKGITALNHLDGRV